MKTYSGVYEQFFETASFLWILRAIALNQPHYYLADVLELEQRIDAQIEGLMISVEDAWKICQQGLTLKEAGEVFTATLIAFKSHDAVKIQKVIEAGLETNETFKGLVSALAWLPEKFIHVWIKKFLNSKDLHHKHLALAVCSLRQENPGEQLTRIFERKDCKQNTALYSQALQLAGDLKRQDLIPFLNEATESDDKDIKFWSNYASIQLGNHTVLSNLEPYVFHPGPHQAAAINLVFKMLPVGQARQWISRLGKDSTQNRMVIKATGVLGDPHAVNWLIKKMHDPVLAKLAAEAFTLITGLDLRKHKLIVQVTPDIVMQPNDNTSDQNTALDDDENLPYPDAEKIASIWMSHGQNFVAGQRYFLGKAITADWLKHNRKTASQRQRHLANLELMLLGDTPLFNTYAKIE